MAIMENVKNVVAPNKLVELALYYPKALFNFDFLQISKCINSLFLIMEKHYLRLVIHKLHHQKEKKVFFFFFFCEFLAKVWYLRLHYLGFLLQNEQYEEHL